MNLILPTLLTAITWLVAILTLGANFDLFRSDILRGTVIILAVISTILLVIYIAYENIRKSKIFRYRTIPEFKLEGVKFYELSMILDGTLSMEDVLSMLVYYTLNPPQDPDTIEQAILRNASSHTINTLYRIHYLGQETEEEREAGVLKRFFDDIRLPIIKNLQRRKMFRFNPYRLKLYALGIFVIAGVLLVIGFGAPTVSVLQAIILSLTFTLMFLSATIVVYANLLYENSSNLIEVQTRAKGYEMYLKTVEWYTVEQDQAKLEQFMPYFILFGLKQDRFEYMIHQVQEKLQGGTKDSIFG